MNEIKRRKCGDLKEDNLTTLNNAKCSNIKYQFCNGYYFFNHLIFKVF